MNAKQATWEILFFAAIEADRVALWATERTTYRTTRDATDRATRNAAQRGVSATIEDLCDVN